MPAAGHQGVDGALTATAAPVDSMGMSDSDNGAPWRLGSGFRLLACCSQSLQEYIIVLVSVQSREIPPQMAAGWSEQSVVRPKGHSGNVSFMGVWLKRDIKERFVCVSVCAAR